MIWSWSDSRFSYIDNMDFSQNVKFKCMVYIYSTMTLYAVAGDVKESCSFCIKPSVSYYSWYSYNFFGTTFGLTFLCPVHAGLLKQLNRKEKTEILTGRKTFDDFFVKEK